MLHSIKENDMQKLCLKIAPGDNVAVAVKPLRAGTELKVGDRLIVVHTDVPAGQNVALIHLEAGDFMIKYGCPIGYITDDVDCGCCVDDSNARTAVVGQTGFAAESRPRTLDDLWNEGICRGYMRKSGVAGTRNDIWIVAASDGLNGVLSRLVGRKDDKNDDIPGIDDVVLFPYHPSFLAGVGTDEEAARIWRRWIFHPNAGGVLVVALEKEAGTMPHLKTALGKYDTTRIRFVVVKEERSGYDLLSQSLQELTGRVSKEKPADVRISSLKLD